MCIMMTQAPARRSTHRARRIRDVNTGRLEPVRESRAGERVAQREGEGFEWRAAVRAAYSADRLVRTVR
jgi:hypothetical protein